jgi:hypothetical protein
MIFDNFTTKLYTILIWQPELLYFDVYLLFLNLYPSNTCFKNPSTSFTVDVNHGSNKQKLILKIDILSFSRNTEGAKLPILSNCKGRYSNFSTKFILSKKQGQSLDGQNPLWGQGA